MLQPPLSPAENLVISFLRSLSEAKTADQINEATDADMIFAKFARNKVVDIKNPRVLESMVKEFSIIMNNLNSPGISNDTIGCFVHFGQIALENLFDQIEPDSLIGKNLEFLALAKQWNTAVLECMRRNDPTGPTSSYRPNRRTYQHNDADESLFYVDRLRQQELLAAALLDASICSNAPMKQIFTDMQGTNCQSYLENHRQSMQPRLDRRTDSNYLFTEPGDFMPFTLAYLALKGGDGKVCPAVSINNSLQIVFDGIPESQGGARVIIDEFPEESIMCGQLINSFGVFVELGPEYELILVPRKLVKIDTLDNYYRDSVDVSWRTPEYITGQVPSMMEGW